MFIKCNFITVAFKIINFFIDGSFFYFVIRFIKGTSKTNINQYSIYQVVILRSMINFYIFKLDHFCALKCLIEKWKKQNERGLLSHLYRIKCKLGNQKYNSILMKQKFKYEMLVHIF